MLKSGMLVSTRTVFYSLIFFGLIFSGCDMGATGKKMPDTETFFRGEQALALAKAIEKGDVETIRQLSAELDINQPQLRGMTYLNWAFAHEQFESAEALLALQANPEVETDGVSPLELAMKMDDIRWLKLLVESGADINRRKNATPLWFETLLAHHWQHLDYLLKQGIDVNAADGAGNTAIINLAGMEQYGQVLKLIDKGADISAVSNSGLSFAYEVQESTVPETSPEYANRQKVIGLLGAQGVSLPVPSPREVRSRQGG
jgi:hypothetical protein